MYDLNDIGLIKDKEGNLLSGRIQSGEPISTKFFYCRVSSKKQEGDLERQVSLAKEQYPKHNIIKDVGSGLNWKRKGLRKLLKEAHNGKVSEVIIFHKDRLCRFGFEILEYFFALNGVSLMVHDSGEQSATEQELAEDLLSIVHVFSARQHGRRGYNKIIQVQTEDGSSNDENDEEL